MAIRIVESADQTMGKPTGMSLISRDGACVLVTSGDALGAPARMGGRAGAPQGRTPRRLPGVRPRPVRAAETRPDLVGPDAMDHDRAQQGVATFDATGRFVLPGLIDCHVHVTAVPAD